MARESGVVVEGGDGISSLGPSRGRSWGSGVRTRERHSSSLSFKTLISRRVESKEERLWKVRHSIAHPVQRILLVVAHVQLDRPIIVDRQLQNLQLFGRRRLNGVHPSIVRKRSFLADDRVEFRRGRFGVDRPRSRIEDLDVVVAVVRERRGGYDRETLNFGFGSGFWWLRDFGDGRERLRDNEGRGGLGVAPGYDEQKEKSQRTNSGKYSERV